MRSSQSIVTHAMLEAATFLHTGQTVRSPKRSTTPTSFLLIGIKQPRYTSYLNVPRNADNQTWCFESVPRFRGFPSPSPGTGKYFSPERGQGRGHAPPCGDPRFPRVKASSCNMGVLLRCFHRLLESVF